MEYLQTKLLYNKSQGLSTNFYVTALTCNVHGAVDGRMLQVCNPKRVMLSTPLARAPS